MEQAPIITDCLTMIRYIVYKLTGDSMPLMYIGSMPKYLVDTQFLNASIQSLNIYKPGDLVFFYGNSKRHNNVNMVKHSGIIIDKHGNYIESTSRVGWATVNNIQDSKNIATHQQILDSKDPRYILS